MQRRLACGAALWVGCALARSVHAGPWDFQRQSDLTKEKIEAFLTRAVVHFETLSFRNFDAGEWERTKQFLKKTQAKFIHGAELSWGRSYSDGSYWDKCKERIADLHATPGLGDVIVEGFIAEHIGSNADETLIPDWLWKEMEALKLTAGRKPSPRDAGGRHYFHYENFFRPGWPHIDRWAPGQSVPDITQPETKLYFRYMLKEHIDAGFEAIWFGGIKLCGDQDVNNSALNELCAYARSYAARHGRRGAVIFTSHDASRVHSGRELLDYVCYPTRMRYSKANPSGMEINPAMADNSVRDLMGILENPADLPVLLEIDNYVCAPHPPIGRGGYDEITGFAAKNPAQRRSFLRQYFHEVRGWSNIWCNRRVHLGLPGRRNICIAGCANKVGGTAQSPYPGHYYSPYREHCGDEDVIAALLTGRMPPPPGRRALATRPAQSTSGPAVWQQERFDGYPDGPVAGRGRWSASPERGSAMVQSGMARSGKAIALDTFSSRVSIENKLEFAAQSGGLCRVSFDLALVDSREPADRSEATVMRLGFRSALPDVEWVPGGTLFFLYWGSQGRVVTRGNRSTTFLTNPESGRWYHIDLAIELDAMKVDVSLDGKPVLKELPLRGCEFRSLGSIAFTGFATGANVQTYLDNLTGAR
jgi:hypothetical protein